MIEKNKTSNAGKTRSKTYSVKMQPWLVYNGLTSSFWILLASTCFNFSVSYKFQAWIICQAKFYKEMRDKKIRV